MLREYDVDDLRRVIGVIFQDFVRYDLKMRENIAVGQIDAIGDQPRIARAAEMSLADSVVGGLESGLDHMLGASLQRRGQPLRGRVVEGGPGPSVHARRRDPHSRRADRRPRCQG